MKRNHRRRLWPLMFVLNVAIWALVLTRCAYAADWSAGPAPKECPTWGVMQMVFLSPAMVSKACEPLVGPNKAGCYVPDTNTAIVPDPSKVSAREFKRIVGHELCHRNGGTHRDNTALAASK